MKKILLLFLIALAVGCSDSETVSPTVIPEVDNSNARIETLTCEGKTWLPAYLNETYSFGSTAQGNNIHPIEGGIHPVAPYQIKLTFQNLSSTTSVKIKVNNDWIWETLSPGEVYTPDDPMFSMTCGCPEGCPWEENISHNFTFKVSNLFGNQTPVDVRVGYIINSPHDWQGSGQTSLDVTHWQP